MINKVRVRFAPSPTGPLHIGGVRTALFNYLFAKKNGGDIILRIEDTDQERLVPNAEKYIIDSLNWVGIKFDESPAIGKGAYGPYRQSERGVWYTSNILELYKKGGAYIAFDTPKELAKLREENEHFKYSAANRMQFKNSLTLSQKEVDKLIESGADCVFRLKVPENEIITFTDEIAGEVSWNSSTLDDKILYKSDGFPTYHFANIVDDHLMQISHVIRGNEWLPSTPIHILLYKLMGWEHPVFAHLPLILKPEGQGKFNKRDGEKFGFPAYMLPWIDPQTGEKYLGCSERGYLPEAVVNTLALLGWNSGTTQELYTMQELIDIFSLDRIVKADCRFDPKKALWFNQKHLLNKTDEELAYYLSGQLGDHGCIGEHGMAINTLTPFNSPTDENEFLLKIVHLIRERVVLLPDLWKESDFFFFSPQTYEQEMIDKIWKMDSGFVISLFLSQLTTLKEFNKESLQSFIDNFLATANMQSGRLLAPLRLLVVGANRGPHVTDIAEIIGRDEFVSRLQQYTRINGLRKM